jgi:hypothetical protein
VQRGAVHERREPLISSGSRARTGGADVFESCWSISSRGSIGRELRLTGGFVFVIAWTVVSDPAVELLRTRGRFST